MSRTSQKNQEPSKITPKPDIYVPYHTLHNPQSEPPIQTTMGGADASAAPLRPPHLRRSTHPREAARCPVGSGLGDRARRRRREGEGIKRLRCRFCGAARLAIYDAADDAWLHTHPRADASMRDRRSSRDAAVRAANAVARATTSDGRDAPAGAATHSAKKQKFLFLAKQILSGPREHVGAPPWPPARVVHGTDRKASP